MPDFFDTLCRTAHKTVARGYYSGFAGGDRPENTPTCRLSKCIRRSAHLPLIAEVKVASPTMGVVGVDAGAIASQMQAGGAVGISVVTEPRFFNGSSHMLSTVRSRVSVPLLMKDFIVSACQIEAARDAGASAVLLIQALFDRDYAACRSEDMIEFAHVIGLEVLLEAHTDSEFERALSTDADLIGINNRDLTTLTVDLMTTRDILEEVPADERVVVSESGVETPEQALFLKRCGADALLIGSAFMRAPDVREVVDRMVNAA